MHRRIHIHVERLKTAFSLRARLIIGAALLVVCVSFFTQFVLAEKEANVYIFPSAVAGDGWENPEASLGQDLSADAELVDFTRENSAVVFFGSPALVASSSMPHAGTVSPVQSVPASDSTTDGTITPTTLPASEHLIPPPEFSVPSSDGTVTPASLPDATKDLQLPEHSTPFPNPFLPNTNVLESVVLPTTSPAVVPDITPPTESLPSATDTQSSLEHTLAHLLTMIAHPDPVLALDVPVDESTSSTADAVGSSTQVLSSIGTSSTVSSLFPSMTEMFQRASAVDHVAGSSTQVLPSGGASSTDSALSPSTTETLQKAPVVGTAAPESADASSVSLCRTFGKPCHVLEYDGFGLGGALDKHALLGATLELSLAGRGALSGDTFDRVLVRVYHAGHWQSLGTTEIRGDISNGKRGGYLKYDLPDMTDWSDLSDLKVVVEYDRASAADASAYVDGIWINARYANDALTEESPEDVALTAVNVKSVLAARDADARAARRDILDLPGGTQVTFTNTQAYTDAALVVKTDKEVYRALGGTRAYFNVTNESKDPQVMRLQFHFPAEGAAVTSLARWSRNIPYKVGELKYDDIGYFCDQGWETATSSSGYHCAATDEIRSCDQLNADKQNCIVKGTRVGLNETTDYRDGWEEATLRPGSILSEEGTFQSAIDRLLTQLPPDVIPSTVTPVAHLGDSILLQPGQTVYFRADITVPLNGRGDFYVEAAAESGQYGLVHAGWDGSWNYRMPLSIPQALMAGDSTIATVAIPVSLDNAPLQFWTHVEAHGNDVRFVDENAGQELPYWLASWDKDAHTGLAWVRVPRSSLNVNTQVALYYGDAAAPAHSDPALPFRTLELATRGIIFGGTQSDMTLHVIALDDHTRVAAGDKPEVLLKKGESALFSDMAPGTLIRADGPITASIEAAGGSAVYVPLGYAGNAFVIPGVGGDGELAVGVMNGDDTHAKLMTGQDTGTIDPVLGSIVKRPVDVGESIPLEANNPIVAVFGTDENHIPAPLYPSTAEDLYGFQTGKSVVGVGEDGTAFTTTCSSGARVDVDGRRVGASVKLDHCYSGGGIFASAVRVTKSTKAVGLIDGVDGEFAAGIPRTMFASEYISPSDALGVSILCTPNDNATDIGVFDASGMFLASSTCRSVGVSPGMTFIAPPVGQQSTDTATAPAVFVAGFSVQGMNGAHAPFLAAIVPSTKWNGGAQKRVQLTPLTSPALSRTVGGSTLDTTLGAEEFVVPGEHRKLDVDANGKDKEHFDTLLSNDREFSIREQPSFHFQYKRQSNGFVQGIRDVLGVKPFTISRIVLKHPLYGDISVGNSINYGDNNEWSLSLQDLRGEIRPGKYTLHVEIEEGGSTYVDEYDFFWGVLAMNYNKTVFTPGEKVNISMGALSNNGNTICDASLKLWITDTMGKDAEVPVASSGLCNGNNVVNAPDYSATYDIPLSATGTYRLKLVRFDQDQNIASQMSDSFEVRPSVPYSISREGPTRIYPIAHYPMKIRVRANEAFEGNIVERIPGDFVVIDRGNADLEWGDSLHTFITATWPVKLAAGGVVDLAYTFDAPDRSPDVFLLGALSMQSTNGGTDFTELRQWQIASDAAGKMMIFWDRTYTPSGWTCVSCVSSDPFYQRFAMGSTTYSGMGGTATDTPTATATVHTTNSTGVGANTTTNTNNAPLLHTHTLAPQISAASNLPTYRQLRVLQSSSAGDPPSIPGGAIAAFDVASSSLPTGWYRYADLDGRYIRGENTLGITSGANTHSHTATGTLSTAIGSGLRSQNGVANGATTFNHTHTLTPTSTSVESNEPPYVETLFAQLPATSSPSNYMITMWDNTPPDGWTTLSDPGGPLNGKFLKASTTYGFSGGALTHTHADIIGAQTSVASVFSNYTANASNAQAPAAHTHTVDITGFSTESNLPPYIEVIFAKRLAGITLFEQNHYRVWVNANVNTPTDPWPPGGGDLDEDSPIDSTSQPVKISDVLRFRMSLGVTNATSTAGSQQFKLQYAAATDCTSALNWTDVGAIGSGALWRGYNNAGVTNNANLAATTLTEATVAESYVEQNNATATAAQIAPGVSAEWDWVVEDHLAVANTNYCFRMVKSDGTPLDTYSAYPEAVTNNAPLATVLATPFDDEKVSAAIPNFYFAASDPEGDDLDYEIQVSSTSDFAVASIDKDSTVNPELFDNVPNPSNKAPFNSGDQIHFAPASALTNGATYWWRVRAKDSNASNTWGPWSAGRSFTVDTTVNISTWFQTTRDQLTTDIKVGVDATSTSQNDVELSVGSSTGTLWSPEIDFSEATIGTAWGSLAWNHNIAKGTITYQVEYLDATSTWVLLPDGDLPGNGAGFTTSPISLLSVDPGTYPSIRLRANFTNTTGTPRLLDWTLAWGYNVTTPAITAPFDNAKVATATPLFDFSASDPQSDPLTYQISWSTSPAFTASTTRTSDTNPAGFQNLTTPGDTQPFNSGEFMRYTIQAADALTNGTTYFYRIRAKDPTGANNWSFWSDTRSLTVDTTVTVATWFQSVDGQFDSDTLTSLETYGSDRVRVATSTSDAMIAYGEGTVQTPKYRLWNGSTWGSQLSALSVGSTIQWTVLRASPLSGEYIMGTQGTDKHVKLQVYNDGVWGNLFQLSSGVPTASRRGVDVTYESLSGRAMAVACDGDADPSYSVWDGTSWSAPATINLTTTNVCEWVRLASNPTSNEIILLERNTGSLYSAMVWNGSSWGNETTQGSMTAALGDEGMAVEYEESGDQGVIVTSNGGNNNFLWRAWHAGAWSGTTAVTTNRRFAWGNLRRDKGSDNMNLCYLVNNGHIGAARWTGAGFVASVQIDGTATNSAGRPVDCAFEDTALRNSDIMVAYSGTAATNYSAWTGAAWSTAAPISTIGVTFTDQLVRTSASSTILGTFFDSTNQKYLFSSWDGASWSAQQTLESTPSVTVTPFGEPFMMAPKNPATQGSIISDSVNFADGVAPAWSQVLWNATLAGASTFTVQVQYYQSASSSWALVPDSAIAGNSTGISTSPITITGLDTTIYSQLRLVGNSVCVLGNCPTLDDWTVKWAAGVAISGTATTHDLTTSVTSGTVAVAVNGTLQSGRTGTISGGAWSIPNVTAFPGDVVTVFVSGVPDLNEAVAVAKYTGPGDMGGMRLAERWVSLGSASTTGQTLSLTDLGQYDNSVSGNEDIFYDVDAGGDFNNCVTGSCLDASIDVYAGTFRPSTATAKTINTWDMRIDSFLFADTNTFKVSGSWKNVGGFTPNTSTIVFNGTSTTRTIDSTGAATSTFYNVTFGDVSGNNATWNFSSAFVATGTVAMNFGTVAPGTWATALQGNLTIGVSGTFQKGSATTTFSGASAKTWTDNSGSKQDFGTVVIDGTAKILTLGSGVKATDVTIGSDDTLNLGGSNTFTVLGNWNNNGTVTAQTGTVNFAATTSGHTINQGFSDFYNTAFTGAGGTWIWQNTNATTTNDLTISAAGTTTLPSGTLAIGGSFNVTAGAFLNNSGVVRFTSTASGKTIRGNGSSWNELDFRGSGGAWTFADTNATTTGSFTIVAGAPTLPSGTFAIGNLFDNQGGSFTANGGTVRMTSASAGRTIRLNGSSLANLYMANAGTFSFVDTNATTTADIVIAAGTTIFPSANFAIGGNLSVLGTAAFTASTGAVHFNPSSGTKIITPNTSTFTNVDIMGSPGATVNFAANATTSGVFNILSGNFIQSSGATLLVGGAFSNQVANAATTWTGATLFLNSGTSYSINTKSVGGDTYGTLKLGANTLIRSWNSSATTYDLNASASLYSQNNANVAGDLYIFGPYTRNSGTDYWDYATDFDGTALGGSSRQANVRFASGASASFTNATLEMLGSVTASTTINRQSTGSYGITVASSTVNAQYYHFNNLNATGLNLTGSTTITSLANGDFDLDTTAGSAITIASTTILQNNGLQIYRMRFALGSAASGSNVTELGTLPVADFIRFKDHYGNLAGEAFNTDPQGNPGNIRWDDSLFTIAISGTVYSDAGLTHMGAPTCDGVTPVVRVKVDGAGNFAAPCASADGTFTISNVTFTGDTVMTIYLDTNGGTRAAWVTRGAVGDLSNVKLYQNRVIVSHEDVAPMTIAKMNAYDGGDDSDIPFVATVGSPNTLVVNPETEFWIWSGKTFVPGGNITLNSGGSGNNWDGTFHIDNNAVFTATGAESDSIGGTWVADAGATFTAASSTFTFTATTSGKSITAAGGVTTTFWNLTFNGQGGNWAINQQTNVGNNLTVTAGTLSGANSMTVSGANATGNGAVAFTGGTFTLASGGTFGGSTDWSFNNLNFGSGDSGTTAKTGSSTITISGVLTVAAGMTLQAGSPSTWNLSGGGTPFVLSGTLDPQSTLFRYSATSATNITAATYYRLFLAPSAAGGPTYTLGTGAFAVNNNLTIGDGVNAGTTTANTNDPALSLFGDVLIRSGSTFVASDSTVLNVYRDWSNSGTFTHSNGTVNFVATTTGHTITPGASPFYAVNFNDAGGGWTIAGNATSTNFSLSALNSFTMASGTTLEVKGIFTNSVGGSATTWTGSTLYMNSGAASALNTKSVGADQYGTLNIAANTKIDMWNSAAATTLVASTGSLYSKNHNNVNGALDIYGAYARSSGTDYWDNATDFDGVAVAPRQVNVRIAPSASVSYSGTGALEAVGSASATTTIDVQSAGTYAFNISGGSTTMRFLSVRNTDTNGLNFSGTPTVNRIDDADFQLGVSGGSMITVAGATIDANPLETFMRNRFATSTGVTSGFNVKATGTSASAWRFNLHYGNLAGETYDSDPGGDPGYLIWDDSAAQITISGNVYSDEGTTPIGSPACNGVTQNVRLKVEGLGSYTSACDQTTGAFSISNIIFNPGDTLTLYLDTNGGAKAANISLDPATNINNMHLYQDRVIVRHEGGNSMTITAMNQYDADQDTDIPFKATIGSPNTLIVPPNTALIVWNGKTFAPGGNVTVSANAQANTRDGSVKLYPSAVWQSAGTETHTIGGLFTAQSGAALTPASSTFIFNATTTGKSITASSPLTFYNLTLSGVGGAWDISGVGTSTNDLVISAGTATLPSGTLAIGGSFDSNGGSFVHNGGTIKFTSIVSGKNIRAAGSSFGNLLFAGADGAWTFLDTNATTTGSVIITAGTPTLPAGTLNVGGDFDNQGGTVVAGSGTLAMNATSNGRIVRMNGSSLGNLTIAGSGGFTFSDTNATATGDVLFASGSTTLPIANFVVGGNFIATGTIAVGTSTLTLNPTSGTKSLTLGASALYNLNLKGGTFGTVNVTAHATTTNNFTLTSGSFIQSPSTIFTVQGTFANFLGGASTTWTGSTLALNSGTSYTMNTKSQGGDVYGTLQLSANTNIRSWNSSATNYVVPANASLYSQNHGAVNGALNIYGAYARNSGTDYWDYATDFDGTALGGSSRAAAVRFASGASASYNSGSTLEMLGTASATTSVDRQSTGSYGLTLTDAALNADHYQLRNMNITGLALLGATTWTDMNNGDFELATNGGSMITIASTTIDQNASTQISGVRFATTTAVSGANVTRTGTTTNAITFVSEFGNMASELYDNDGNDACGSIRFTDSSCLFSDQKGYRWRNDDGAEGALASEWYSQSWSKRQRVTITNTSASSVSNAQVKITVPYDANMQSNFNDLRFTDSSGTTSLPYWVEASTASVSATVWVKVPLLPASGTADVFMYYGNGSATSASSGTSTFKFFDDFEDNNITEYTGDTSLFANSTSFNYERTYGLAASAGNTTAKNTSGIGQVSAGVGRDTTFHFFQYVDMSTGGGDEPCFLFAIQSPITAHQNYGVCLQPFGLDHVAIVKNAAFDGAPTPHGDGATQLATTTVTFSTGWYETSVDWLSSNQINVTVYDSNGAVFATLSTTDSSYTSGGVGFTFWGQHGGWDIPSARAYISSAPTAVFGLPQQDSGATWKAAENTPLSNLLPNQNVRLRFTVRNSGTPLTGQQYRLQVASKTGYANCESVPSQLSGGSYSDVPASSVCGSNPACMAASTQFSDKSSTTQMLSTPTGGTFTYGQIMKDLSDQTDLLALASGAFTELEYNFQMTAYATENAYCFRVVNGASNKLDNYTKVAEMSTLHPPTISNWSFNNNSNIALTEGTTTLITATGTITDLNGYADIVAATSTFYRSSVAGGRQCAADNNNCYQIATTSCLLSACSGNSCTVSCSAPMQYFADPTDAGSIYAADTWQAVVSAWDTTNFYDTSSANEELYTLSGLAIPSTLNYGSVTVGADTGGSDATTSVTNTGNTVLNTRVYGNGPGLISGASVIPPDKQKFATSTFTYSGCAICNILTNSTTTSVFGLGVSKPTSTLPFFKDIYWGIAVPIGTAASTHSGSTTFEAIAG